MVAKLYVLKIQTEGKRELLLDAYITGPKILQRVEVLFTGQIAI